MLEQPLWIEVINHCLESVLWVCQNYTVVSEGQRKDQLLGRLDTGEEATEIEVTSVGSEPDVDAFGQFFLSLSQHHAKEDGKEFRCQHAAFFPRHFRWGRGPTGCCYDWFDPAGLYGVAERWWGTLVGNVVCQGSSRGCISWPCGRPWSDRWRVHTGSCSVTCTSPVIDVAQRSRRQCFCWCGSCTDS